MLGAVKKLDDKTECFSKRFRKLTCRSLANLERLAFKDR